jgi:hypothetical protein
MDSRLRQPPFREREFKKLEPVVDKVQKKTNNIQLRPSAAGRGL